jgi:hypothetical protein
MPWETDAQRFVNCLEFYSKTGNPRWSHLNSEWQERSLVAALFPYPAVLGKAQMLGHNFFTAIFLLASSGIMSYKTQIEWLNNDSRDFGKNQD